MRVTRRRRIRKSQVAGSFFYVPVVLIIGAMMLMVAFEAIVIIGACFLIGTIVVALYKWAANGSDKRLPKGIRRVQ